MRKSMILLIVTVVVLIGALVFVFIRKDETSSAEVDAAIESFQEAPEPLASATPEPGLDLPSAPEVKFDHELALTGFLLTIDDQKTDKLPCSQDPDSPAAVGRLALDEKNWGVLNCTEIHMGSVGLLYKDQDEQTKRLDLAMQDGDVGDAFDVRAWVRRDPTTKTLEIETIAFESSSGEIGETGEITGGEVCHVRAEKLKWNSEKREFDRQFIEPDFAKVTPPVNASKGCLDASGRWVAK